MIKNWNVSGCILAGKHVSGDKPRVSQDVADISIVLCISTLLYLFFYYA